LDEVAAGLVVAFLKFVYVDQLVLGKLGIEFQHGPVFVLERVLRVAYLCIHHFLLLALDVCRFLASGVGRGSKASGERCLLLFDIAVKRLAFRESVSGVDAGHGDFQKLNSPREVIPTAVILENNRCIISPLRVRLVGEALVYSTLGVLQSDLREVLEHPISLEPRDGLIQEKVTLSFLPFFDVKGFGYRDAIHAQEPQFGNIVVDVRSLILAFPHCLTCLSVDCLSFVGVVCCKFSFHVTRFLLSFDQDDIDVLQRAIIEVDL
jgi:hypothetical protein